MTAAPPAVDALAEFFPLLLLLVYYLLTGRRKAAQRKAAAQRQEAPQRELISDGPPEPTPFQSFLDQLEHAMAEANGQPSPSAPAPSPPEPPATERDERPETERPARPPRPAPHPPVTPEFKPVAGSFDAVTPTDHEAHGFGAENPLSEEAFERRPASVLAPRRRREYDPHGLRPPPAATPAPTGWRQRLADPTTARDAFILQTVFGARGGRARDRR